MPSLSAVISGFACSMSPSVPLVLRMAEAFSSAKTWFMSGLSVLSVAEAFEE